MYKSSSTKYIRSENPVYRWGYLWTSTFKVIRKLLMMSRIEVPQSDWVSGRLWSSPIVPLGPPRQSDSRLSLNIDTYLTYVDKKTTSRS